MPRPAVEAPLNPVPDPTGPRESFEEHIARNKRATVLVMGFMLVLLFSVIYAAGYLWGAPPTITFPLALLLTGGYLAYTYSHSVDTVLRAARARPPNPDARAEKLLQYRVEEMAIAAGIPVPKVYVQDSRDINAFAAGRTPDEAVVCVTTGALEQLDQEELEGVIAHEVAHVLNYDVRLQTVTVAVVGAIAMLSEVLIRSLWFGAGRGNRDRGGHPALLLVAVVLAILAPILSRLVYLMLSRKREYLADATGIRLTRNPEGLARALEKIKGDLPDDPQGSRTVASLYIANPWKRNFKTSGLFSTHPPLDERIRRIRGM